MAEPAIILRHPACPPVELHDPRDPYVKDKYDDDQTRTVGADVIPALQHAPADSDGLETLAIKEGLYALIQKYGAPRVAKWVRIMARVAGQEV